MSAWLNSPGTVLGISVLAMAMALAAVTLNVLQVRRDARNRRDEAERRRRR